MRTITILVAMMAWLTLPTPALGHGTAPRDVATVGAPAAGSPSAAAPRLTKKHSGWRKTACLDCHDSASLANHKTANLKPADCGPCHGYNGAPHEAHAIPINPCGNCHARVEHAATFAAPGDCIKCHVHPKSPQGR